METLKRGLAVDYDSTSMPRGYAAFRRLPPEVMRHWLSAIRRVAPLPPGAPILDVGCGSGRFSTGLADTYRSPVVGFDRSAKMLREARRGGTRVSYGRADACALPVRGGSVALAFLSNVVHHLTPLREAAVDVASTLRDGGFVVVRNYLREQLAEVPYLEFFPEAAAASSAGIPPEAEVVEAFTQAALRLVSREVVRQPVAASPEEYLAKVRARVYSDLAVISDAAFGAGLARMTDAVARGWHRPMHEPIALLSFQKGDSGSTERR